MGAIGGHSADLFTLGDLVEQLGREAREELRVAEHALVAPAVEEQRLALAVAGVLDMAEEE